MMHERHVMDDLIKKVEAVAAENNATRVKSLHVWLGALSHFSAGHFYQHFQDASRNTIAEGAILNIEENDNTYHYDAQRVRLLALDIESDDEETNAAKAET